MMIIMMMMTIDEVTIVLLWKRCHFKMRKNLRDYWICLCDEYYRNNDEIILTFFRPLFAVEHFTGRILKDTTGGETGFDGKESKLPTYWNTSSKIFLGMKIDQQLRFVVIHKLADSLCSLIADGKYRATSLGRQRREPWRFKHVW